MQPQLHTVRPPDSPPTGGWFFRPFPKLPEKWRSPEAQDQLLHEWLISYQSIPNFAVSRGLTVDQLFDWLHSEQIIDRRKRMEHMAAQRAESLARLNLPDAIGTLAATMRDANATPKERRLAASAIVRVVAKADRDHELTARATSATAPRHTSNPSPSSPTGGGAAVLRGGGGSVSSSSTNPQVFPTPKSASEDPRPILAFSSDPTSRNVEPPRDHRRAGSPKPQRPIATTPKPTCPQILRRNRAATSPPPRSP